MGPIEAAIRKSYVAYDEGDIEAILKSYSRDVTIFAGGDPEILIYAGTWGGRDQAREFLHKAREQWQIIRRELTDIVSQNDQDFSVSSVVEARNKQTGKTAVSWKIDIIRFREGRMTHYAEYMDTAIMQAAAR
jgi:ketosteroid isomerase-like protein